MRQGLSPQVVMTKKGQIYAIATGSDACAEHEMGAKSLLSALCHEARDEAVVVSALKARTPIFSRFDKGGEIAAEGALSYPDLLESKRLAKNLDALKFVERSDGTPEALLYFAPFEVGFDHPELVFPGRQTFLGENINLAGAWDERSFALRVRGDLQVKALREFYQALMEQKVIFGGLLDDEALNRFNGIVLVNTQLLSPSMRQSILNAQAKWESALRLKALDDARDLTDQMQRAAAQSVLTKSKGAITNLSPGHLWVRWADKEESAIVYCLNPGYGIKADYLGPYTREQLLDWARTGYAYPLHARRSVAA